MNIKISISNFKYNYRFVLIFYRIFLSTTGSHEDHTVSAVQIFHKTCYKMPNKTNMIGTDGADLRVCYLGLRKIH